MAGSAPNPYVIDFSAGQNMLARWGQERQQQRQMEQQADQFQQTNMLARDQFGELQKQHGVTNQLARDQFGLAQNKNEFETGPLAEAYRRAQIEHQQASTYQARQHGEYYRAAGAAKSGGGGVRAIVPGIRADGSVYNTADDSAVEADGTPRVDSRYLADGATQPGATQREHADYGRTGVTTTDVPGVVTRSNSGVSDRYASEAYEKQRTLDRAPEEDRQRYLKRMQDRALRETVYGKPPANHEWDENGRAVRISQPPETAADRQSKTIAAQGMYNLDLAEKALVGKDGKPPTVGTAAQIVGDSWKLPKAVGGAEMGQWGEGGIAFRQAKRAILDLNFALSGKSVSNAEREAFLELYMPKSTESRASAADKLQSARVFFKTVLQARNKGGTDDDIAAIYRERIHVGQGGSSGETAKAPPPNPAGDRLKNKYGLE